MNLKERNEELTRAREVRADIIETREKMRAAPGGKVDVKIDLAKAQNEFNELIKAGKRDPRVMELNGLINDLQDELRGMAHAPFSLENDMRRLRSDLEGFRARDHRWLQKWRIGREPGMGGPVDVESLTQCELWLDKVQAHAGIFLDDAEAEAYFTGCKAKLERRRAELAAGRHRNAEADAEASRLRAEVVAERYRRAEESRVKLEKFDQERADFRAKLDREMAAANVQASLDFDRRAAKKEVKRHAWLVRRWRKIAKARKDPEFRTKWLEEVSAKSPERGRELAKVFRSAGDAASATRASEQFDLIRERWERVVVLLDADPALTSDEAEALADPEYQEQREELRDIEEERLAARNEAQST